MAAKAYIFDSVPITFDPAEYGDGDCFSLRKEGIREGIVYWEVDESVRKAINTEVMEATLKLWGSYGGREVNPALAEGWGQKQLMVLS